MMPSHSPRATIAVLSDTHGDYDAVREVLIRAGKIDALLHLGDHDRDMDRVRDACPFPVYTVRGNCDGPLISAQRVTVTIAGIPILAVHGHQHYVKSGTGMLLATARGEGYRLALFGHTHEPLVEHHGDCLLVNPGSASLPRNGHPCTFSLISIDGEKILPRIISL